MRRLKRLLDPPTQSFFLLGPRGTGKTTWLKDHYPNAVWIDLLLPNEVNFYIAKPERLISTTEGAGDIMQLLSLMKFKKSQNYFLSSTIL